MTEMPSVIVLEGPNEGLGKSLCAKLNGQLFSSSRIGDRLYDIMLVSPHYRDNPVPADFARTLIIPSTRRNLVMNLGYSKADGKSILPKQVITYGMSLTATLTLSSITKTDLLVELRRSVLSVDGYRHEESEYPIRYTGDNMAALAEFGTMLAIGAEAPMKSICPSICPNKAAYSVTIKLM